MSESTATKSRVFKEDIALATGATGAEETGTRTTSTGGEVTLTKLDATHIPFRSISGSTEDLIDGGQDLEIKPGDITMNGTLTNEAETSAGFVKNDASGVYSGGNSISTDDLPSAIPASSIADGTVSNTEFQYLNGVTSNIQTQLDSALTAASQAEQEAGTEAEKYVAPATQQFHPSSAKAWFYGTLSGGTLTEQDAYNCSVVRNSSNHYTVTFAVAFSDTTYVGIVTPAYIASGIMGFPYVNSKSVGSCTIIVGIYNNDDYTATEVNAINMVFYGDQ